MGQNRTKVGLKREPDPGDPTKEAQAKSNQGGIETDDNLVDVEILLRAKSNQGGIETTLQTLEVGSLELGKIEPRWD